MKFTKKWMVVLFDDKEPTHVENILKNKDLTNNEKVKFYNELEIKKIQNDNLNRQMKNDVTSKNEIETKSLNINSSHLNNSLINEDKISEVNEKEEYMDVDLDTSKNIFQQDIKNTIKKKLQNTKTISEKNLLKSLLKDI